MSGLLASLGISLLDAGLLAGLLGELLLEGLRVSRRELAALDLARLVLPLQDLDAFDIDERVTVSGVVETCQPVQPLLTRKAADDGGLISRRLHRIGRLHARHVARGFGNRQVPLVLDDAVRNDLDRLRHLPDRRIGLRRTLGNLLAGDGDLLDAGCGFFCLIGNGKRCCQRR